MVEDFRTVLFSMRTKRSALAPHFPEVIAPVTLRIYCVFLMEAYRCNMQRVNHVSIVG
jgi:hypothetical protein